jgi:periplasmic protein TonB
MTNSILIIVISLSTVIVAGQDTTYFDSNWNKVSLLEDASFYEILQFDQVDYYRANVSTYYKSGQIKKEVSYSDFLNRTLDGKLMEWYESGQLYREIDYQSNKINGNLVTFWENGLHKRIDTYKNGNFLYGMCFDSEGFEIDHYAYRIAPEFPGGEKELLKFLATEIKYPAVARSELIEGSVIVSFIIDIDGTLQDIKIEQSPHEYLSEEALRMVDRFPRYKPGMIDGELVSTPVKLPIRFKIE